MTPSPPKASTWSTCSAGHAPCDLRDARWDKGERSALREAILDTIEEYTPGFSSDIVAEKLLVPRDLKRIANLPQGQIFHGELAPDQLFFQWPVSGFADYRTPCVGCMSAAPLCTRAAVFRVFPGTTPPGKSCATGRRGGCEAARAFGDAPCVGGIPSMRFETASRV
jgi:hypothetical protein